MQEEKLFSVNGAADLLERDLATLVRALRHVPPDGYEAGQPRWRMPTIVGALAVDPRERRDAGLYRDRYGIRHSKALNGLRVMFENGLAQISAEECPVKQRQMAFALAPVLQDYQKTYLQTGRSLGIADDDALGARADLIVEEMVEQIAEAGQWNNRTFFGEMVEAMGGEEGSA